LTSFELLYPSIGGKARVKPARDAVPPVVVTLTAPVAPVPTTALILDALLTVYDAAGVPPKLTAVAPVKLVPVIITVAPGIADVGEKEVIAGAGTTGGAVESFLHDIPTIVTSNKLPAIISHVFLICFIC
jgi:hypothetical protein